MPKVFNREIPMWVLGLGVVVLGGLVWSAVGGDDTPVKSTSTAKKAAAKTSQTIYTDEDSKGPPFAHFTEPMKNAFLPAISKNKPGGSPNAFDSAWAGGESGWSYTGYVTMNGQPQALLENSSTGEGDYVSPGEKWKASTIAKITQDTLELSTATGLHRVKIGEGSEHKGGKDVNSAVAAANPATALEGPIGNQPMAQLPGLNGVTPDIFNGGMGTQTYTGPGNGYGGRRRGRFGRGGFGGGNGGG